MFWDKSKRFVKKETASERPFSDNVVTTRDDIGKVNKGPKMVDNWRQSPTSALQQSSVSSVQSTAATSFQPVPPKDPQHSNATGFRRGGGHARAGTSSDPALNKATKVDTTTEAAIVTTLSSTAVRRSPSPTRSIGTAGSPTGGVSSIMMVDSSVLNVPGPCSYYPELSPQFQPHKGTIVYTNKTAEKRKPTRVDPPSPAPGIYFQPSTMVKPSFNKQANKRAEDSDNEPPPPPVHRIVLDLQMCSIGKRSKTEERRTVRNETKNHLQNLLKIKNEDYQPFSWPPKSNGNGNANTTNNSSSASMTDRHDVQLHFDEFEIEGMSMQSYIDSIVSNIATKFDEDNSGLGIQEEKLQEHSKRENDLTPIASYVETIIQETTEKLNGRNEVTECIIR